MGIFSNFFNGKNKIEERIENINILRVTMQQNEALTRTKNLVREIIENPSLLNGINSIGAFGNFLTNQFNTFNRNEEIQIICELAFFASTKALIKQNNPNFFYDRLITMYNAEDFFIDIIKDAYNLKTSPLSIMGFHNKHLLKDMLLKMRYHDLFNENKFYRNGSNDSSFNRLEFIKITNLISNQKFESDNPNEIIKEGKELIDKCYNFISIKYSLKQ